MSNTSVRIAAKSAGFMPRAAHSSSSTLAAIAKLSRGVYLCRDRSHNRLRTLRHGTDRVVLTPHSVRTWRLRLVLRPDV